MRMKKYVQVSFDIEEPISMCLNLDRNLFAHAQRIYNGRCIAGCYIINVLEITRRGELMMNPYGPARATINVQMLVDGIYFRPDEIITGCEVIRKTPQGLIICKYSDYVYIGLNHTQQYATVTVGQMISVRVAATVAKPGAGSINVSGVPFLPKSGPVYHIPAGARVPDNLLAMMDEAEARASEVRAANAQAWEFFSGLLYAYRDKQPVETIQIRDLGSKDAYVCRDIRLDLSLPEVAVVDVTGGDISPPQIAIADIVYNYLNYLQVIVDHVEIYNEELADAHENLWILYDSIKQ